MTTENTDIAKELRERSLRAEQEGEPCPDCGGETFRDEGRVTWCRDCGWNKSPSAFVGGLEGQWTFEKCPKCYARMLKNDAGDRWCSYVNCSHSILPNAGGMARELAAQDSESPTKQNG